MKKRFLGIICILYASIIGYVWFSNRLKNYLAPQMQIYLKGAFFVLIIIGIVICISKEFGYKFKISDLILILPLVALILAGDGRLTATLANNRMLNLSKNNKKVIIKKEEPKKEDNIEENIEEKKEENDNISGLKPPIYFKVIDEDYYDLANHITYTDNISAYEGKTISVSGFVTKYASYIPFDHFAIGKYGVSCCTADAGFVGFIAKLDENLDFKINNNGWYEIEGVLEAGKDNDDYNIMVIRVTKIKEIDGKKEDQYVYPCESYGNNCQEFKKYNLEYAY